MICTVCGNDKLSILTRQLRNSDGEVWYCDKCDMGLLKPAFKDVKEYYDKEYRKKFTDSLAKPSSDPDNMYQMRKNFQRDRVEAVRKYFDKSKNFLEIGCSAGQFLTHVYKEFSEFVGVELDTHCAKYVEEKFGVKVYSEEIANIDFGGKKFDYIAFFQVLEHTTDPAAFLEDVKKLLKPGGKMLIEVPNLYDPLLHLWKVPSYNMFYYHEAHTHYFSRKSLEKLFAKCGLKADEIQYHQDYNLLNNLYWAFNNGPQKDCVFGLSEPQMEFQEKNAAAGAEINEMFKRMNREYIQILGKHELTSNMFAIVSAK